MNAILLNLVALPAKIHTFIWMAVANLVASQLEAQELRFIPAKPISSDQVQSSTNSLATSFEGDAMQFCALLEGWAGSTIVEAEEFLSRAFISQVVSSLPDGSRSKVEVLTREFKPRIVEAFQRCATAALREAISHEELLQLIAFYKTPLGQKYARVYPSFVGKMWQGDLNREILRGDVVKRLQTISSP